MKRLGEIGPLGNSDGKFNIFTYLHFNGTNKAEFNYTTKFLLSITFEIPLVLKADFT